MDDNEFLAIVEKCRNQRGALLVIDEAGRTLPGTPPLEFGLLEKLLQEWSSPVPIDEATRLALLVLEDEPADPGVTRAKDLLLALRLAAGERAAESMRARKGASSRVLTEGQ